MKNINRITFVNFLSVLLLQGISLISSPLFSSLLGTSGYGTLSTFNAWVNMASTVLSLQTHATIVNARQEYPEEDQPGYQSAVMVLSLIGFLAGFCIIMLFSGSICRALEMDRFLLVLVLVQAFGAFCVNFLSSKFTYEFKAEQNMRLSLVMAIANILVSLALVLNMPQDQRYLGRIGGEVIVWGTTGIAICLWVLRRGKVPYRRAYWKFALALGCPLIFQNLAYSILGNSDVLMLQQMVGSSASGIYSLAVTVSGVMFTIFTALNSSWVPFFFEDMKLGNRENVIRQGKHFTELYTVLCMGFILLIREVYHVYAKDSFWSGIELIPIYVANYFGNMLCTFPVNYEIHRKKTIVVAAATVAAALANVGLNYLLIGRMGMMGAAVATLLARLVQLAIHEIYCRLRLGRGDYPFSFGCGALACGTIALTIGAFYIAANAWYLRWAAGAALGIWELCRIRKRRSLL